MNRRKLMVYLTATDLHRLLGLDKDVVISGARMVHEQGYFQLDLKLCDARDRFPPRDEGEAIPVALDTELYLYGVCAMKQAPKKTYDAKVDPDDPRYKHLFPEEEGGDA